MHERGSTRREFLGVAVGGAFAASGYFLLGGCARADRGAEVFITKAATYREDMSSAILSGFRELKVDPSEIRGKRILLKPNLVEPHAGAGHINTHPHVVRGAVEAFLRFGASHVVVGDGPGHCRDTILVLEESGLGEVLLEDGIPYRDMNYEPVRTIENAGRRTRIRRFALPEILRQVDWIVSVAKMKVHHWAGVTLSMKNLFGVMPGLYYGWPKNLFHWEGIDRCILDIHATVKPHFAIIDGITGMEGDGPIMGTPRHAGVLVMGRNLPAVDATGTRIMGLDPHRIPYLEQASGGLGPIREKEIRQRGEPIASVRTDFALAEDIHAYQGIRLSR